MSSEKRTIKINPELFKVPDKNTSRKKREKSELKIKVRPERQMKNKSLRRSVMKMIREKQQEEYKKLFSNDGKEKEKESKISQETNHFNKDFENSLEYFHSLVEKENEREKERIQEIKNNTLKHYPEISNNTNNISYNELPNVLHNIVPNHSSPPIQIHSSPHSSLLMQVPKYGCLKNGTLPTYRNYHNSTRRLQEPIQPILSSNNMQGGTISTTPLLQTSLVPTQNPILMNIPTSLKSNNELNFIQNDSIKKDLLGKSTKISKRWNGSRK